MLEITWTDLLVAVRRQARSFYLCLALGIAVGILIDWVILPVSFEARATVTIAARPETSAFLSQLSLISGVPLDLAAGNLSGSYPLRGKGRSPSDALSLVNKTIKGYESSVESQDVAILSSLQQRATEQPQAKNAILARTADELHDRLADATIAKSPAGAEIARRISEVYADMAKNDAVMSLVAEQIMAAKNRGGLFAITVSSPVVDGPSITLRHALFLVAGAMIGASLGLAVAYLLSSTPDGLGDQITASPS